MVLWIGEDVEHGRFHLRGTYSFTVLKFYGTCANAFNFLIDIVWRYFYIGGVGTMDDNLKLINILKRRMNVRMKHKVIPGAATLISDARTNQVPGGSIQGKAENKYRNASGICDEIYRMYFQHPTPK